LLFTEESEQFNKAKDELKIKEVTDSYEIQVKNKKRELRHWLVSGARSYDINGRVF
jgi:hypothetical protein